MPTQNDYRAVAEELKRNLGKRAFQTMTRLEVTDILRRVSGEPHTRIKVLGSQAITNELANLGLVFYPDLYEVGTHDSLRLFRSDSFLVDLISIINDPTENSDARLREALKTTLSKTPEAKMLVNN